MRHWVCLRAVTQESKEHTRILGRKELKALAAFVEDWGLVPNTHMVAHDCL